MKYSEAKLKCVKARNEYILQLEAANATLNKYYDSDMENLLDVSADYAYDGRIFCLVLNNDIQYTDTITCSG